MSAGSITHFILGFVVLYLMSVTMGLPNIHVNDPVPSGMSCARDITTLAQSDDTSCPPSAPRPAEAAGMKAGDRILSVAGKPTPTWIDTVDAIQAASGPTVIQVQRANQTLNLTVDVPRVKRLMPDGTVRTVGMIGASQPPRMLQYGALDGFGASVAFTGNMFAETGQRLLQFPQRIPAVVDAIFGGQRDPNTPVSVVGASRIGGQAVEQGLWFIFFLLLASLNFFVGVFNLLPLLPMDGGHIAIVWYERVRDWIRKLRGRPAGGPVDYSKLSAVTMVLVLIGGAVTLLTVTADIVNPIRL
jgi:membrane-associated protease RseP (regulator of RpoE activity)